MRTSTGQSTAILDTAADVLTSAALTVPRWTTSNIEVVATTAGGLAPTHPGAPPLRTEPTEALPNRATEPYIPQQPRMPPPRRRFSPTRFIRRQRHQCVRPASVGRQINAFRSGELSRTCRNRHCPKCQSGAAKRWLDARQADLLPVEYYHVVFTLPAPIADIAYQNKAVVYGLLFDMAAETLLRIAADPKHLGASIGATLVLHTWGSALTHHPHVHGIVPGGGLAPDGKSWIACRPGFFLPVRVLSRLFRRRFLDELLRVHQAGKLRFFGEHAPLADVQAFKAWLAPLRQCEWVVYTKRPFAGPQAVLAYLSRYTHRVAISNSRLIVFDEQGVTFKWKDYRVKNGSKGRTRHKTMTLEPGEFMRRFLLHVLPGGFHRIRHYGLLANGCRKASLTLVRELLCQPALAARPPDGGDPGIQRPTFVCWHCGHAMAILQTFSRGHAPAIRAPPSWQTT